MTHCRQMVPPVGYQPARPECFWHSPGKADELADARRMGGLHRRKKRTVAAIYGFGGLRTVEDTERVPAGDGRLERGQALLDRAVPEQGRPRWRASG